MVFKKKKTNLQYKALNPSDGNPGGLTTPKPLPFEEAPDTPPLPPKREDKGITEEEVLGYGLIRLLREVQGLRAEQLEIIKIQEKTLILIASLVEEVRKENGEVDDHDERKRIIKGI